MRQILAGVVLVSTFIPMAAFAQAPQQPTCEQRAAVMGQLIDDLSISRRNAEIEIAALKVQLNTLKAQVEASKRVEESKAP